MTLEEAYSVGKKYGFTFNGIGPSLSVINNKVGVCLNLLDQNYGYLKRNFSFESVSDFDSFLKKYNFYLRNKDKENTYIVLDNYEILNPTILYSFEIMREKRKQVDKANKELLLKDIKQFLNSYYSNFDEIINSIKEKILIEQDYYNKFNHYKKLLYKTYNQNIDDNIIKADETKKNSVVKLFDEFKKNKQLMLDNMLDESYTLTDIEEWYKELIIECQKLLINDDIIRELYEKAKFEQHIIIINRMIDYLLNNDVENTIREQELQKIKDSIIPVELYEDFFKKYENKVQEPYLDLDLNNVLSFNSKLYGSTPKEYTVYKETPVIKVDNRQIEMLYNDLGEDNKRALMLLYSPLKPILNYIIEQAYRKNTLFNFKSREFKSIYEELVLCLDNSENLVFKLKYFKDIKLDNYDVFIKSLVKVAKTICSSYLKLPFDKKLYSLNFEDCLITGSDKIIQKGDDVVRIIDAKEGCYVIYSPYKIIIDSKKKLFMLKENVNVLYFPSYNNKCENNEKITKVSIFEEGYSVVNVHNDNLLVVTNMVLQDEVSFSETLMAGRSKCDK